MEVYKYRNKIYPEYLKQGNAQQYIQLIALKYCKGKGLDIGGTKEWCLPNAEPINNDFIYNAYKLPDKKYDYIFSSHTLEHLENYVSALELWTKHIKKKGTLFLYLPHRDMEYWRPENNKKHKHVFYAEDLVYTLKQLGYKNIFYSERDLFYSFAITGEKC